MSVLRRLRPTLGELRAYTPPRTSPPVKLDANESPWPLPEEVRRELAEAMAALPLHRYPDARATRLRDALAGRLGCEPDELVLGTGSDEVISILYGAFGAGAVLTPSPTFVMYRISALTHGLEPLEVPLRGDWSLDVEATKAALATHRPVLAFYARPNNPTGASIPEATLEDLVRAAPDTLHVIDEAYIAFQRATPEAAPRSLGEWCVAHDNVAVMGTLSKIGLAGLRVGWLRARPALAAELEKVRQPFNLDAPAQEAARLVLERHWDLLEERVRDVVRERGRLLRSLGQHPSIATVWPSEANFVLVRPRAPAAALAARLRSAGVAVRAFGPGPLEDLLRISVGTPADNDRLLGLLQTAAEGALGAS